MSKNYLGVAIAPRVLAPIGAVYTHPLYTLVHNGHNVLSCTLMYPLGRRSIRWDYRPFLFCFAERRTPVHTGTRNSNVHTQSRRTR